MMWYRMNPNWWIAVTLSAVITVGLVCAVGEESFVGMRRGSVIALALCSAVPLYLVLRAVNPNGNSLGRSPKKEPSRTTRELVEPSKQPYRHEAFTPPLESSQPTAESSFPTKRNEDEATTMRQEAFEREQEESHERNSRGAEASSSTSDSHRPNDSSEPSKSDGGAEPATRSAHSAGRSAPSRDQGSFRAQGALGGGIFGGMAGALGVGALYGAEYTLVGIGLGVILGALLGWVQDPPHRKPPAARS